MNGYLKIGIGFVVGSIVGGFAGYRISKNNTQKIADKQVEEVKESLKKYYENKISDMKKDIPETSEPKVEESVDLGVDPGINDGPKKPKKLVENTRERFQGVAETVQPRISDVMTRPTDLPPTAIDTPDGYPDPEDTSVEPYLIREKDYGELDDWDTVELILWKDGTVSTDDSMCEIVSPTLLFKLLPEKWSSMFNWDKTGKYEESLYFRNNAERKDIQINKDYRTYREWMEEVYPGRLEELDDE